MIELIFYQGTEIIVVRIDGHKVEFGSTIYGARLADITGLRLDYHGTIREFPDLKDDMEWRMKAIQRFKNHIATLPDEEAVAEYLIYELRNKGYTPKLKQKAGFRRVAIQ